MSMRYIRDMYKVPAKRGMLVHIYYKYGDAWSLAKMGRITSATHLLFVDGGGPYHPTQGVVYFDEDGKMICDTRVK